MKVCLYSGCSNVQILSSDNHVEVRTVLPNATTFKNIKSKLQIRWAKNGDAVFHRACWDLLVKSSRARKKHPHLPKLTAEEKSLVKEAAKTVEFFDSVDSIKRDAAKCAKLIIASKHCTAFTGAGISTSAGIGDYRGKSGKWTQQDQNALDMDGVFGAVGGDSVDLGEEEGKENIKKLKRSESDDGIEESADNPDSDGVPYESLRPTYTHEALYRLMEGGHLQYIISQNGDGLHGLSGVPEDKMSELHGSAFVEVCEKCGWRYSRSYYVMDDAGSQYYEDMEDYGRSDVKKPKFAKKCDLCGLSHRTGRVCQKKHGGKACRGQLKDSIINFRDNLEEDILSRAEDNAQRSDLMLCLGSTLMVTPANSLVEMTKEPRTLAICNRQATHMDDDYGRGVRVFGDCDVFMKEVMSCILATEDLQTWEEDRKKRMTHYNTQRVVP